jgi:hypothetical protein
MWWYGMDLSGWRQRLVTGFRVHGNDRLGSLSAETVTCCCSMEHAVPSEVIGQSAAVAARLRAVHILSSTRGGGEQLLAVR